MGTTVALYFIHVIQEPVEFGRQPTAPYAHIRSKPFPWGDGDTELFNYIGKKWFHLDTKKHQSEAAAESK
jgi:hypothetical protein